MGHSTFPVAFPFAAPQSSLMSGPRLDELLAFNAHRKRLLREMMTLQVRPAALGAA